MWYGNRLHYIVVMLSRGNTLQLRIWNDRFWTSQTLRRCHGRSEE